MGMMYGGTAKKKKKMAGGGKLHGGQTKLDMNKDGTISDKDFDIMRKK